MRTALIARVSSSRTPLGACSRSSCSLSAQVTCRMGETLGAETSTVNPTASLLAAAMGTTQLPSLTPQSPVLAGVDVGALPQARQDAQGVVGEQAEVTVEEVVAHGPLVVDERDDPGPRQPLGLRRELAPRPGPGTLHEDQRGVPSRGDAARGSWRPGPCRPRRGR